MKSITKNNNEILMSLKEQIKNKRLTDDQRIDLLELINFQTRKVNSLGGVQ